MRWIKHCEDVSLLSTDGLEHSPPIVARHKDVLVGLLDTAVWRTSLKNLTRSIELANTFANSSPGEWIHLEDEDWERLRASIDEAIKVRAGSQVTPIHYMRQQMHFFTSISDAHVGREPPAT